MFLDIFFLVWGVFVMFRRHLNFGRRFFIFCKHLHDCVTFFLELLFSVGVHVTDYFFYRGGRSVSYSIAKVLARDWHAIVLLAFFDLDFDLIVFSKIGDLLYGKRSTFESIQPFLIPYLFIATKFLGGSLIDETACSCHPETTESTLMYLHGRHIDP